MALYTAQQKLKERIKELTCLYEVSSLIGNSDYEQIEEVLWAITACLQKAWQYNEETYVELKVPLGTYKTKRGKGPQIFLESPLRVFNEKKGYIKLGYPSPKYTKDDFLLEEKQLLDNVCLEVGNLLERKEIKENQ